MSEGDLIYPRIKERAEKVFSCTNPACTNIKKGRKYFPRGILYLGDSWPDLMLLTPMPGIIFDGIGEQRWSNYEQSVEWEKRCFSELDGNSKVPRKKFNFHKNVLRCLEFILHSNFLPLEEIEQRRSELTENIFSKVYKTHLVKCTCRKKDPKGAVSECVSRHLKDELEYCCYPPILCLHDTYDRFWEEWRSYSCSKVAEIKNPSATDSALVKQLEKAREELGI